MSKKILLFGATGMIGKRILAEAQSRGYEVTAAGRATVDVLDQAAVAAAVPGHDVVISAFGPGHENPQPVVAAAESLTTAMAKFPDIRIFFVGGAATLEVAPGVRLLDTGNIPAEWLGIAKAHAEAWKTIEASQAKWTYVSPSAFIQPGERTGKFRVGTTQLIVDAQGNSAISAEDFAVAMIDEIGNAKFVRARFTVGY